VRVRQAAEETAQLLNGCVRRKNTHSNGPRAALMLLDPTSNEVLKIQFLATATTRRLGFTLHLLLRVGRELCF
jgi:hypothetical protein